MRPFLHWEGYLYCQHRFEHRSQEILRCLTGISAQLWNLGQVLWVTFYELFWLHRMKQGANLSTDEQGSCIRAGSWLAATHRTEPQSPKPGSPSSHLLASFVPSEIFPGTSIYSTALSEGAQGSVLCTIPCRSSQHLRSPAVVESS